ncbi:MAG: DUF932 domain-containing protein [Betaproteobacteria bacterium]|nr:DUF932 domain-containing protein [Betaproteobacteria bacterium]
MELASRFRDAHVLRSNSPLSDDQIRAVAPSIFAEEKHTSRSARYTYIPTIDVLAGLKKEGFQPFMVCQTKTRDESRSEFTKHLLRLRHADQINGDEANEIILLNSHDGTSSYQMLAGCFRFVCQNGMVRGNTTHDIRLPHKGNIVNDVIEGAFTVLDEFEDMAGEVEGMKALPLTTEEQGIFARHALAAKYEDRAAPITQEQALRARRFEDRGSDLWSTFQRVQENVIKGGLQARTANGRHTRTRPVQGIDQSVRLNRLLWSLAQEMRALKA